MVKPAKSKGIKLSLGDFLGGGAGATSQSWADDEPEEYGSSSYSERPSSGQGQYQPRYDSGMSMSKEIPIPDRPPFKAFIRNLDFKTESQDVEEFLAGCRLVEFHAFTDRDTGRAKGYGILEFEDRDSLVKALDYSGRTLLGREVRLDVAEARPGRDDSRGGRGFGDRGGYGDRDTGASDDSNWLEARGQAQATRPPSMNRSYNDRDRGQGGDRSYGDRDRGQGGDRGYGSGYGDRDRGQGGDRSSYGNRDGGDRGSYGSRDNFSSRGGGGGDSGGDWGRRSEPVRSSAEPSSAAPASRPRLNLQPRSEASAKSADDKKKDAHHDPFGAAKPVDTAAREAEMEKRIAEKRAQVHAQGEKDTENRAARGEHRGERGGYGGGRDRERGDRPYEKRGQDDQRGSREPQRSSPSERSEEANVANKFADLEVKD